MRDLFYELSKIPFSKSVYISGLRALNILDNVNNTGDWHKLEMWKPESLLQRSHIMGDYEGALMDTSPYMGSEGIFNANNILRKMGVPKFSRVVYAASHARAIADFVLVEAFIKRDGKIKLFSGITLADFNDFMPCDEDKEKVYRLLQGAALNLEITQSDHVVKWLDAAKSNIYDAY